MTKSWEGVRQEACRLYVNGATLQQVEDRMKEKHNFKASYDNTTRNETIAPIQLTVV